MVLADLGDQITSALRKLHTAQVVDEEVIQECLKEIANALLQSDVNVRYVAELRSSIRRAILAADDRAGSNKRKLVQQLVLEKLVELLTPARAPYKPKKGKSNVILFVGLQGSGKTTTCAKYAHYYQRKGWKVALVCADTFRAGAFDQLKQNATKIGIPFYGSYTEADPVQIGLEGVERFKKEKFDMITVDISGRHRQESALFSEMRQLAAVVKPDDIVFIMDSHIGQACFDQATAFSEAVDVGSVIVTKLDGHAKGGGALSAVSAKGSPITFLGTGEHFDELEPFNAESFVSRLLGMGDIKGLLSTVVEAIPLNKQPEMLNRLAQGIFTFRDMRDQFQNVMNMGSLSHLMSMLPGMAANLIPKGWEKEGITQLRRFLIMMDSMTTAELDNLKPMTESRIVRIARGSGHQIAEVKLMIEKHKEFAKMIGKLGKMGLGKKGMDMSQMMRNPAQMMQNMQKAIDPRILKQMGGTANMMNMMKQLESMPDMQQLMKSMGGAFGKFG